MERAIIRAGGSFDLKKALILDIEDPKALESMLTEKRAELRFMITNFGTRIKPKNPKLTGQIKKTKKDIARILTKLAELNKNVCKKGGRHFEGINRNSQKFCKKCGVMLG